MTRSSTKELFSPLENPEQKFCSRRRLFDTPSLIESNSPEFDQISNIKEQSDEEVRETMTETMEQYMSKTIGDYGSGVTRPTINQDTHFELKGKFLKELCNNTSSGLEHEDANEHIKKVLEIKVNEKVYAAHVGCELCKGPHNMKDFPQKKEGKTLEEAYYIQFDVPYQPEGHYRAAGPGFYQQNNGNSSYPDQRPSLEESLTKFTVESAKRHEENSNIIKVIRASTDAAIKNQEEVTATIQNAVAAALNGPAMDILRHNGKGTSRGTQPEFTKMTKIEFSKYKEKMLEDGCIRVNSSLKLITWWILISWNSFKEAIMLRLGNVDDLVINDSYCKVELEKNEFEVEVENKVVDDDKVDDDIKVKTRKSVDSEFMVMEAKRFSLMGMYVEGWEDEDKDLNVFDYDCEMYDFSTKALFGKKEFFVNKKQEDLDKIKRVKLSDVDAMSHECNLGRLEFGIWKWSRRKKLDDTSWKFTHKRRKVDVWRWPHKEKGRKSVRRARNNAYELAKNSLKWGDKLGIELVKLELADSNMEKGRPSSSLANKEGPADLIEVLFDVFDLEVKGFKGYQKTSGKVKAVYVRKDAKVANVVKEQKKASDDGLILNEKMVSETVQETNVNLIVSKEKEDRVLDWWKLIGYLNQNKENRKWLNKAIDKSPYVFKNYTPHDSQTPRLQTEDVLTGDDLKHYEVEIEAMNLILISIQNKIYKFLDACTTTKAIWERVERLMQETVQNKVNRETQFNNEFDQVVAEPGEALVSIYNLFAQLMNDLERNGITFPLVTVNTKFLYGLQPEWLKAKKLEKSHDPLALVAHMGSSSSTSSPYYVTHPSSVVDYDDDYQEDVFQNNFEDLLTSEMKLLARAITQRFSNPTNNHLHTSSNIKNQAIVQANRVNIQSRNSGNDGRNTRRSVANVQCYNCSEKSHYAHNYARPRVLDSKIQPSNIDSDARPSYESAFLSEDNLQLFVFDLKSQIVELQKTQTILKQKMSENEDKYHDTVLDLEAKVKEKENAVLKIDRSLQGMFMLGRKPMSFYDPKVKHGLGFKNSNTLKKAISQNPKLYDASCFNDTKIHVNIKDTKDILDDATKSQMKMESKLKDPIAIEIKKNVLTNDYNKLNSLYEDLVPQKELSAEQKYFSSTFIPFENHSTASTLTLPFETKPSMASMPRLKAASGVRRPSNRDSPFKNSLLSNTKKSSKKVEVSVRTNKKTYVASKNVISNKKIVTEVFIKNALKENDKSLIHYPRTTKSTFNDIILVVSKNRFSVKSKQSKSLDTTPVVSRTKIGAVTPLSAKNKVIKLSTCPYVVSSCVAGLGYNLFSVGQFCDGDLDVAFRSRTCYVQNMEGDDLLIGDRESNLYTIFISDMAASSPGKGKKSSHQPKLVPSTHSKLELLHMDLCGPMRVAIINEKKYILGIVDDYSRFTWVYFLHAKDETPEIIKKLIAQVQLNYNARVHKIRTDNGTEFKHATPKALYEKLGIMQQFSIAQTPQQNGVVGRHNRTLVELHGYKKEEGIDFEESFNPVDHLKAFKKFLAYVAYKNFTIFQMNVKTAFLNEPLK
nr:hypothetical protein [Tanacetum cinerariifolium]